MNQKKHNYIQVKLEDFLLYQEKYKHDRLDRWNRVVPPPSKGKIFAAALGKIYEEEIFNGLETKYSLKPNKIGYLILFKTDSGTEYRFDLIREPNTNIYDIGFSLSNAKTEDYDVLTDKKESLELFNKLIWILKDATPKLKVDEYCIGLTDNNKKNKIYQYMMRCISGWEKRNTDKYPTGWALYFKI